MSALRDEVSALRDEVAALRDVFTLAYDAGKADGWEAARAEVLCLPPRVPNHSNGNDLPPRHLTVVRP